jgi:hypothetical protein
MPCPPNGSISGLPVTSDLPAVARPLGAAPSWRRAGFTGCDSRSVWMRDWQRRTYAPTRRGVSWPLVAARGVVPILRLSRLRMAGGSICRADRGVAPSRREPAFKSFGNDTPRCGCALLNIYVFLPTSDVCPSSTCGVDGARRRGAALDGTERDGKWNGHAYVRRSARMPPCPPPHPRCLSGPTECPFVDGLA